MVRIAVSYSGGNSLSLIWRTHILEQPPSCSHRMQCLFFLFCPVLSQWIKQQVGITGLAMAFCVVCWQERQARAPCVLAGQFCVASCIFSCLLHSPLERRLHHEAPKVSNTFLCRVSDFQSTGSSSLSSPWIRKNAG